MIGVTGGSGFFGAALVEKLLDLGWPVRVLDREEGDDCFRSRVDFRLVDISDYQKVVPALKDCEIIYHNAALVPVSRAGRNFWEVNVKGTENILKGAFFHGVRRVIHYSTSQSLYGLTPNLPVTENTPQNPFGDYGKSKSVAETICHDYRRRGLDISIVRPRTIVGAGRLGIFQILFERIRQGKSIPLPGGGQNKLQFVGLEDLIDASWRLLNGPVNEDFNVGAEEFGTLSEDLLALIRHAGTRARLLAISVPLSIASGWLLDKAGLSPFVDLHYRTIHKNFYFDVTKAKQMLNWQPKESNLIALIKAYDWYVKHRHEVVVGEGSTHRKGVKEKFLRLLP